MRVVARAVGRGFSAAWRAGAGLRLPPRPRRRARAENDVVWYQQRGLAPSAPKGRSRGNDVGDARRVLDALGWDRAYVVGHSWGGHLALHVAEALPERLFGVLAVDPLGSVGDGRWPEFDEEILRRTPEEVRARARELDELNTEGAADDELALEQMRLVWPAYFADAEQAPAMPVLRMASERSAQMGRSILSELPLLEAGLAADQDACRLHPRRAESHAGRRVDGRGGSDPRRVRRGRRRRRPFRVGRGAGGGSRLAPSPHSQEGLSTEEEAPRSQRRLRERTHAGAEPRPPCPRAIGSRVRRFRGSRRRVRKSANASAENPLVQRSGGERRRRKSP